MDLFQQLAENANRLSDRTPEEAAKQRKAARELNMPSVVVKSDPNKAYNLLDVRDSSRRLRENQKLAKLAAQEYDIVKDDLGELGTIEKYARSFGHGAAEATGRTFSGIGESLDAAWRTSLNAFASVFLPDRPKGAHFGAVGQGDFAEGWRGVGDPIKKFSREKIDIPDSQKTFGTNVSSGLGQLIPMAASAIVPGGVVVSGAAQGADAMAEDVRDDKASQQNKDLAVLGSGAFTGLSDRLVFGRIFGGSAPNAARGVRAAAKRVAIGAASEGLQETSESLVNDALRKNLTKADHEISLAKALEGGAVGATVGGIATGIVESALGIKHRGRRNVNPIEEAAHLRQQAQNITTAKTTERAPDLAADYVNDVYGDSKHIYIDSEALAQSGMLDVLSEHIPERAEAIREAAATGGMVEMTRGEFHTYLPQDAQNQLADHIRAEPDAMTATEAAAWRESGADEMFRQSFEESMQAQEAARTVDLQREALMADLTNQLMATNRYTPEQAAINAELAVAGYTTMAQRSGLNIDELYGMMPLNVVGETLGGQGFEQALSSNPPRGWVHSDNPQDAVNIWTEDGREAANNQAVFWTFENAADTGLPDTSGYSHSISKSAAFHIYKEHGNAETEKARGQIEVTREDLARIPSIVTSPDEIVTGFQSEQGAERVAYLKKFDDALVVYVAEASRKKKDFRAISMRKYPPTAISENVVKNIHSQSLNVRNGEGAYLNDTPADSENQLDQSERGFFSPSENTIALLQQADASTFAHELGHFFLEMQMNLAERAVMRGQESSATEKQIVRDMNALLKWFGIKDVKDSDGQTVTTAMQRWREMDLSQQREYHEQFARGFEAYLFEGKSPSLELRDVFRRFSAWLKHVYRRLTNLNVQLTDDVRAVYGRILASDEEISNAEYENGMMPTFESAEQMGVSQEDFAKYREMNEESAVAAREHLQGAALRDLAFVRNIRNRKVRELKKQYRADFEKAELAARRSIMSQPVYRAYQLLTAKMTAENKIGEASKKSAAERRLLDPTEDSLFTAIAKLGGLNRDELVQQWGLDKKDKVSSPVFGMPVLRRTNGRSIDAMVEVLAESGYLPLDNTGKADVRDLEERFAAEMRGDPVYSNAYIPRDEVKAGSHVENIYALSAVRFDADSLAGMGLSQEIIGILEERGMVLKKGGVHPDFVADMVLDSDGLPVYATGEDLVFALTDAEPPQQAIEQTAYLNLLAEKGEVPTAAAFEGIADLAVHNDVRARILATEYRALNKAVGSVSLITRAAKTHARERVAQMRLADLQPLKYTRAEAKAAKAVQSEMAKGNIEAAAAQKRNQVVQNALAREVMEARELSGKTAKELRQLAGKTFKKTAKSYDADVMTAAQSVAAMFGQSTEIRTERAESNLERVKQYDPQTYALIEPMLARAEALAMEVDGDFSALTVEQMTALKDDVNGMMHLARRMKQVEIDGKRVNIQDIQEEMKAHLDTLPKKWANKGEAGNLDRTERALSKFYEARAALMRVESWAEMMDGKRGKVFKKYIFQPIKDAADNYRTDKGAFLQKYRDIINEVDFGGGKINAPELGFTFGHDSGGSGMNELMHAILHTGNASNKRKLLLGRKWATENADGSLNTSKWDSFIDRLISEGKLTKQHFDMAQKVWDLLEEMKPKAQKTHREVFGYYFDEITAEPFITPFGEYRGGYVPAITDTRLSLDADIRDLHNSETENMQFAFPTTSKGFTKGRVEYNSPLLLNMNSLSGHIDKVLKFSHLEIPVRDVSRIMSGVEKEIDAVSPKAISGMIKPWLTRVATQQLTTSGKADAGFGRVMAVLRNRAGMAAMIGNIPNAVQQLAGYTVAAVKVKPSFLTAATVEYVKNPKAMSEAVTQASQYMDARLSNQIGLMTENIEQIIVNPNAWQKVNQWSQHHAYFAQSFVDSVMSVGIWQASYNQAISDGLNHKDAVRFADGVIRQTQGSTLVEDVSRVETGHPFMRLFTQFYGYFNMLGNLLVAESKIASRDGNRAEKTQRLAYIWGMGYLLNVFAAEALMGLARGGFEDEDKDSSVVDDWLKQVLIMSPIKTAAAMVPQGGNIVNLIDDKVYNDRAMSSPAVSMIERGSMALTGRANFERQSGIRDAASALAIFGGVPLAPLAARPVGYLYGINQGDIDPTSNYDLVRGAMTGVASPDSK